MAHSHHHHHGPERLGSLSAAYVIAIALNLGYVILEAIVGFTHNSMGLLSDAGHKTLDCFWLLIALIAFRLTASKPRGNYTYGYGKASVIISLVNAAVITIAVFMIFAESVQKLAHPADVDGAAMSWTAGVGIVVSGASALLMMKHRKGDVNTRGAFLHMATDALVSLGVVVSGIVIHFTGWNIIDPIISLLISAVILENAVRLLRECFRMSVDAVPAGIDRQKMLELICSHKGVDHVEDLHIRALSVFDSELTARVYVDNGADRDALTAELTADLKSCGAASVLLEMHAATGERLVTKI